MQLCPTETCATFLDHLIYFNIQAYENTEVTLLDINSNKVHFLYKCADGSLMLDQHSVGKRRSCLHKTAFTTCCFRILT